MVLGKQDIYKQKNRVWNRMANRRGKEETVTDFIFLGSKTTAVSDCSHEIKICLFLERKAMTKLDNMLKSRGISLFQQRPI